MKKVAAKAVKGGAKKPAKNVAKKVSTGTSKTKPTAKASYEIAGTTPSIETIEA